MVKRAWKQRVHTKALMNKKKKKKAGKQRGTGKMEYSEDKKRLW